MDSGLFDLGPVPGPGQDVHLGVGQVLAEVIARLSAVCPLLPGDLIFTGTPSGVGSGRTPPRFLTAGDVLTSRVEGIGELRNRSTAAR